MSIQKVLDSRPEPLQEATSTQQLARKDVGFLRPGESTGPRQSKKSRLTITGRD